MIVVICTTASGRRRGPAILTPHGQWLPRLDAEQIYGRIRALRRQLAIVQGRYEPFSGKLSNTVIKITTLKCTEHQNFPRGQLWLKIRGAFG
jgi:hypothetical protein